MDSEKIVDILTKFESNSQRGILIDGSWGIGKTYQLNKYIEKFNKEHLRKKSKIVYVSLFGTKSVGELHTELYLKLNPSVKIAELASGLITPAVTLIPVAGNAVSKAISYAIGAGINSAKDKKKKIRNKNNEIIILLDDIERVHKDFEYSELLGYINKLYLSQIKVVCICDSSKITKDGFAEFKEKIFDRYYKVTKANKKIIEAYFDDNNLVFDNECISIFKDNLRTAFKTSLFYKEVMQFNNNLNTNEYYKLDRNIILWYTSLIVAALNSDSKDSNYQRQKNEFDFTFDELNKYFSDEKIADSLNRCVQIDNSSKRILKISEEENINKISLIICLAYAYLYDDYSRLNEILLRPKTNNEINVELFYLSTDERKNQIGVIIENTISNKNKLTENEIKYILSIFDYSEINEIKYDEKKLIHSIAERCIDAEERTTYFFDFRNIYSPSVQRVIDKIYSEYNSIIISNTSHKLCLAFEKNNYNEIYKLLNEIKQNEIYHVRDGDNYDLVTEIKSEFISNNFYMPSIKGSITEEVWSLAHKICSLLHSYKIRDRLYEYLVNLRETSNNVDGIMRTEILLKNYFGWNKQG